MKTIGLNTPVTVRLTNAHGVRRVDAYLEQNGARFPVYEESRPSTWIFSAARAAAQRPFDVGKGRAPNPNKAKRGW